jgi:NTP pyrophosphatase (non-canonical NTP hydrolase)
MQDILRKIRAFRDERDWMKFHDPKNLAVSITIEAAELLEHFQWKDEKAVDQHVRDNRDEIAEEIADVAMYLAELADNLGIDLIQAMEAKLEKNAKKYPVAKAKGVATKYDKL